MAFVFAFLVRGFVVAALSVAVVGARHLALGEAGLHQGLLHGLGGVLLHDELAVLEVGALGERDVLLREAWLVLAQLGYQGVVVHVLDHHAVVARHDVHHGVRLRPGEAHRVRVHGPGLALEGERHGAGIVTEVRDLGLARLVLRLLALSGLDGRVVAHDHVLLPNGGEAPLGRLDALLGLGRLHRLDALLGLGRLHRLLGVRGGLGLHGLLDDLPVLGPALLDDDRVGAALLDDLHVAARHLLPGDPGLLGRHDLVDLLGEPLVLHQVLLGDGDGVDALVILLDRDGLAARLPGLPVHHPVGLRARGAASRRLLPARRQRRDRHDGAERPGHQPLPPHVLSPLVRPAGHPAGAATLQHSCTPTLYHYKPDGAAPFRPAACSSGCVHGGCPPCHQSRTRVHEEPPIGRAPHCLISRNICEIMSNICETGVLLCLINGALLVLLKSVLMNKDASSR